MQYAIQNKINLIDHKLVLLDTNVISNLFSNGKIDKIKFFNYCLTNKYIICYTIYNIKELKNGHDNDLGGRGAYRWNEFIEYFSTFPSAIIAFSENIILQEYRVDLKQTEIPVYPLMYHNAGMMAQMLKPAEENFEQWINNFMGYTSTIKKFKKINKYWEKTIAFFNKNRGKEREFVAMHLFEKIGIIKHLETDLNKNISYKTLLENQNLKSLQIMLDSFYFRYSQIKNDLKINDMYDIFIMTSSIYMDLVITEKLQDEVFKQTYKKYGINSTIISKLLMTLERKL